MFLMSIRQVLQNIECFCDRLNNPTNVNDSDLPPWFCQGPSCLWRRWDRARTPPGSLVWPPPLPPDCRALASCCWSDWWSRDRRIPAGRHCSLRACSVPGGGETPVNIINYKNLTSYHLLTVNNILKNMSYFLKLNKQSIKCKYSHYQIISCTANQSRTAL